MTTDEMRDTVAEYLQGFVEDVVSLSRRGRITQIERRGGPGYEELSIKYADREDEEEES